MDGRSTRGRRRPNDPVDRGHFNQISHVPIPELIEIVPLEKPVSAEITVPGSKSITNRALILAALAEGQTTLQGALWSEDTQVMVESLRKLGFTLEVEPDPDEFCNRAIIVTGLGGRLPNAGTSEQPLQIFVGNAGTAARFLAALVCLGQGAYRLHGAPRMHERPQAALFRALLELGYKIDSPNDRLPAVIHGAGPRAAQCRVSIEKSSQFASALLLCAKAGQWHVIVSGEDPEESSYIGMTTSLLRAFPGNGGTFAIEADASSGSYFVAAAQIQRLALYSEVVPANAPARHEVGRAVPGAPGPARPASGVKAKPAPEIPPGEKGHRQVSADVDSLAIRVAHWPSSKWQVDERFMDWMSHFTGEKAAARTVSRHLDLGDSIMTLMVLAPLAGEPWKFSDLGRLRVQESERVAAFRQELTRCGARVEEEGDTLTVFPSELHGAEIETYNDHRMAMCFAILGLKVPGIKLKNPACVKKTFPNFFQKLAAKPPHGLGALILDARTRHSLRVEELFAD